MTISNVITFEDRRKYADVDKALSKFYEDTVKQVSKETNILEAKIRRWFGETLITSGIRAQVNSGATGLPKAAVELILAEHLIRVETSRGGIWYELSHDRLIEPVLRSNAEWFDKNLNPFQRQALLWKQDRPKVLLFNEQMMAEVEEWVNSHEDGLTRTEQNFWNACLEARQEAEEERAELAERAEHELREKLRYRRTSRIATGATVLATLLLIIAGFAIFRMTQANRETVLSKLYLEAEKIGAEIAQNEAETARNDADRLKGEADRRAKREQELASDADTARKDAEESLKETERQKDLAEKLKTQAVEEKTKAQRERAMAKKLENLGELYKEATFSLTHIIEDEGAVKNAADIYTEISDYYGHQLDDKQAKAATYSAIGFIYTLAGDTFTVAALNVYRKGERGSADLLQKNFEKAIINYDKSTEYNPKLEPATSVKKEFVYMLLAPIYERSESFEKAVDAYFELGTLSRSSNNGKEAVEAFIKAGKLSYDKLNKEEEKYFKEAVAVYNDDDLSRARTLVEIGHFYGTSKELDNTKVLSRNKIKADEYFKQAGEIFRKLENLDEALVGILSIADFQKETAQKVEFYQYALKILDKQGLKNEKILMLIDIGEIYRQSEDKKYAVEAKEKYEEAIKYFNEDDYVNKVWALIEIGRAYYRSIDAGERSQAENYFKRAQNVYRERSDNVGETLTLLEICKSKYNGIQEAVNCFQQEASKIPNNGNTAGNALISFKIGELYRAENTPKFDEMALDSFQLALTNYQHANDRMGKSLTLVKIGAIHYRKKDASSKALAKEKFAQAIAIQTGVGDELGAAKTLVEIGISIYVMRYGNTDISGDEVLSYLKPAIEIYKKFPGKDIEGEARALTGIIHTQLYLVYTKNDKDPDYEKQASEFYEKNLLQIDYIIDYQDSTLCFTSYRKFNPDKWQGFFKQIANKIEEQKENPLKSIEDRRKQALTFWMLGSIYSYLGKNQKSKISFFTSTRLAKQIGDEDLRKLLISIDTGITISNYLAER